MIEETLQERSLTHGDFSDNARITQAFKQILRKSPNWEHMTDVQKEGLEMISHKMSRIVSGDCYCRDTWHDIQGYAKCVEDRL